MIRRIHVNWLYFFVVFIALAPLTAFAATGDPSVAGAVPVQLVSISALVAMALPGLIAFINRYRWSPQRKAACAFGICLAAAVLIAWWDATIDWANLRITILTTIGVALGFYHAWWRPSGLADAIEKKTG